MSKLLINEPPLLVLPSLANVIGLNEAITLQQIHYWLDPRVNKNFKEGLYWVYNSYEEWQVQFSFWSIRTIRRNIQSLEESNLLISKVFNTNSFDKTKWYSINYEVLEHLTSSNTRYGQNGQIDKHNMDISNDPNLYYSRRTNCPKDQASMSTSYIEAKTTTKTTTNNSFSLSSSISKKQIKKVSENFPELNEREKEMLEIWNEIIEEKNEAKVQLTSKRAKLLDLCLTKIFKGDIDQWKQLCLKIASSKFLMGEITNFKIKLDWILKEENLLKILENNYVMGDRQVIEANIPIDITEEIISDPLWKQTREELKKQLGEGIFNSWIAKLGFEGIEEQTACLLAPTKFIKEWIMNNYCENIKKSFNKYGTNIQEILIQIAN